MVIAMSDGKTSYNSEIYAPDDGAHYYSAAIRRNGNTLVVLCDKYELVLAKKVSEIMVAFIEAERLARAGN